MDVGQYSAVEDVVQYSAAVEDVVQYSAVSIVQCDGQRCILWCGVVLCSTVHYSTVSIVQCNIIFYISVR